MTANLNHLAPLGLLLIFVTSSVSSSTIFRRHTEDTKPVAARSSYYSPENTQTQGSNNEQIVMGKFKAPIPERFFRQRIPKSSEFGSRVLSESFRVSDGEPSARGSEKVVHGIIGASSLNPQNQRTISAKMQVSDDGLNYPPSKLSADIYGNVAEIVTAPPEAVDNDFLIPFSKQHMPPNKKSF